MATNASSIRATVLQATLKQCPLFSALDDSALAEVAATCSLRGLEKGEFLFHEGDPAEGFFVVQTGAINVHRISPDGREQVIRVFRPYSSFAEIALSAAEHYPVHAMAIQASQVLLVQRRPLRELIQRNPDIAFHIISSMSNHFRHLVQMLEDQKFKDIESRLSHWLLRHLDDPATDAPGEVRLDTSKKLLANRLGVASETLSRAFARFREAGWIEVDGPRIQVLQPGALRAILEAAE
ncbi:MAG: Crp/FNR family transcriptional regulator [Puniceicoccaceae bacterium 5H]|nr:MAG: Crp/FNR family transcriptional regulator [Puniceicoccaceae bacterium 5H]